MPKKKAKSAGGLSVGRAAKAISVSAGTVRNWLRDEKALARLAVKQGDITVLPPAAMKLLGEIKKKRMASAPPSLLKAWAGRRAKSAARRSGKVVPATKAAKPKPAAGRKGINPGLEKAWAARRAKAAARRAAKAAAAPAKVPAAGWSGDRVAKMLGTNKVRIYQLLKKHGIKKGKGARSFTPEVVDRLRSLVQGGATAAAKAVRSATPAPVRAAAVRVAGGGDLDKAWATVQAAVNSTMRMAAEFRETMERTVEKQLALLEKAMRPVRVRFEKED